MNKQLARKKIVILDGRRSEDRHLDSIHTLLMSVLRKQHNCCIQTFRLRETKLNLCIGCFDCWLKTPGKCIHRDAGPDILRAILSSHTIILFTPVVFGGYSSELKKIMDRFLPTVLPFLNKTFGELHHPRRYANFPHIVGIGTHKAPNKIMTQCFKTLVGRNAINFSTTFRANVICTFGSPQKNHQQLVNLLSGTDKPPVFEELNELSINDTFFQNIPIVNRKALLIVGSQKIKHSSTSSVLGGYLLKRIKKLGMQTETFFLKEHLLHGKKEQIILCQAVDQADIIIFAFPLYVDSLPFLATKTLEIIGHHHKKHIKSKKPALFAGLVNSGFPDPLQNIVALSICRNFAIECGMTWAGGLTFGAGEMLISGNPLTGFKGFRGAKRPPLLYAARALDIAASSLVKNSPIPKQATHMLARKPIPLLPVNLCQCFLMKKANSMVTKEAKKNGITKEAMYSAPYSQTPLQL